MSTNKPASLPEAAALCHGQEVLVSTGSKELGRGVVDDFTTDGSIVWIRFGGAVRKMFIPEDGAEFRVV